MFILPSAAEAHELASKVIPDFNFQLISQAIVEAINMGHFSCNYYNKIDENSMNRLYELGYEVQVEHSLNGYVYYEINW